jgi:hypothetical protein
LRFDCGVDGVVDVIGDDSAGLEGGEDLRPDPGQAQRH